MSSPVYRNAVAPGYGGSTYNIALPSSTAGDLNLLMANFFNGTGLITVPSGWTTLLNTGDFGLFYRIYQTGDATTITFSRTSASYGIMAGIAYSNVDTAAPIDQANWCISPAGSAVYRAPPVHPTFNGDMLVVFYGDNESSGVGAPTVPGSLTTRGNNNGGPSSYVGDKALTDGSSTGNLDATWAGGGRFGAAIAVKGAGATTATPIPAEVTFGGVLLQQSLNNAPTIDLTRLGVQQGDLVCVFLNSCDPTLPWTPPTGYTQKAGGNGSQLFVHNWQTGDTLSPAFTGGATNYNMAYTFVLRTVGVGGTTLGTDAAGYATGTGTVAAPSVTATDARDLLLSMWSRPSSASDGFATTPAGLNATNYVFTSGPLTLVAWANPGATGATGAPTASASSGSGTTLNVISALFSPTSGAVAPAVHVGQYCVVT